MPASTPNSSDLSSAFPEFTAQVDAIAPNIIRAMYDQLAATTDQPDKLRAIVRELVQTRLKLHLYIDKYREEEQARGMVEMELANARRENARLKGQLREEAMDLAKAEPEGTKKRGLGDETRSVPHYCAHYTT